MAHAPEQQQKNNVTQMTGVQKEKKTRTANGSV